MCVTCMDTSHRLPAGMKGRYQMSRPVLEQEATVCLGIGWLDIHVQHLGGSFPVFPACLYVCGHTIRVEQVQTFVKQREAKPCVQKSCGA